MTDHGYRVWLSRPRNSMRRTFFSRLTFFYRQCFNHAFSAKTFCPGLMVALGFRTINKRIAHIYWVCREPPEYSLGIERTGREAKQERKTNKETREKEAETDRQRDHLNHTPIRHFITHHHHHHFAARKQSVQSVPLRRLHRLGGDLGQKRQYLGRRCCPATRPRYQWQAGKIA